jgi:hypothetical protein
MVVALMMAMGAAVAVTVDPSTRMISSSSFEVRFSATNPEEISQISWRGSPNLTATGVNVCGDPLEYWGNSWAAPDSGDFTSLVGWGQTGTWSPTAKGARIDSASASASGCFGSIDVPIHTTYQFWDHGPVADRIKASRTFDFRTTPLGLDFRPYMPRLYPLTQYGLVIYPDATGTSLRTTPSAACPFGCQITDWDDSWFAIHDAVGGSGVVVRMGSTGYDTDLWVDEDLASFGNASGVLLIAPPGGFTDKVSTTTFMCFYDSGTWTPSLTPPPGC